MIQYITTFLFDDEHIKKTTIDYSYNIFKNFFVCSIYNKMFIYTYIWQNIRLQDKFSSYKFNLYTKF